MTKGAIRPDFFAKLPSLAKDKQAEEKGATKEERQLYALSSTAGWRVLRDLISDLVADLEQLNSSAIASGASFEEIGKNALVIDATKGILEKVINRVEDARESIDGQQK